MKVGKHNLKVCVEVVTRIGHHEVPKHNVIIACNKYPVQKLQKKLNVREVLMSFYEGKKMVTARTAKCKLKCGMAQTFAHEYEEPDPVV